MLSQFRYPKLIKISTATVVVLLVACGSKQSSAPQLAPEVGVVTVQPTSVPVVTELPGRTSAFLVAQVRARVDGIVLTRDFVEGSEVKAGQRLYKIDPAPYIAALAAAKATLANAEASVVAANSLAARDKVLVAGNAVSKQEYDNAVAAQGQALANVAAGKAAVDTAQINLGYTDVLAPISGRIGVSTVTPGAYVQASQATLMSTVQTLDPVYVDLMQSSLDGLKLRRDIEAGRLQASGPNAAKVKLILEDGGAYPEQGKLQFSDVTVDPTTGSVMVRAIFPNPQHLLLPGMFVRARIEEGFDDHAFLVPQIGVTHDQRGRLTAFVMGADGKVQLRQLVTSGISGSNWIVDGGLNPGDRVIVQGIEKVQPGMAVRTVAAQLPPGPASDATAQGVSTAIAAQQASSAAAAPGTR
jgi:membrane fusion protein, multidrug efflux system